MATNTLIMFFGCWLVIMMNSLVMAAKETVVRPSYTKKAADQHRTDSLTILMFLGLLLLTILTVWLFKHRRFRYVHETGLSLVYGLIVGAIIRYVSAVKHIPSTEAVLLDNNSFFSPDPPDYVTIHLNRSNTSKVQDKVIYSLKGAVVAPLQEPPLERAVTFSPEIFFNVLLPVIIFEAGYSMKKRHFFKNLGAILMYALVGTTISCMVVGGIVYGLAVLVGGINISLNDCFVFGAIISATDPVTVLALFADLHVDVDLYALVFGESVLNDAVAIVLSESVETYGELSTDAFSVKAFFESLGKFVGVFGGSFAIGSVMGAATALLTKFTRVQDFPTLETALFFLMSYSTFQAAEAADLTGIVAVLFCGITQAHYTYNNLSAESKLWSKQVFALMNFLAENFVFLYIGVSVFTFEPHRWNPTFIFAAFLGILVARFLNIYPLSFLLNLGRSNKIRANFQHMMMFSGLRGAVAFALSIRDTDTEGRQLMASTTMVIVLATVIICGAFTTPMLQWLQIRVGVDDNEVELHNMAGDSMRNAMASQRQYSTMTTTSSSPHGGSPSPASVITSPRMTAATSGMRPNPAATSAPSSSTTTFVAGVSSLQTGGPSDTPPGPSRVSEKAWLVAKWYNFDNKFMKPLLTNCRPTLMETLPECCMPLARLFTTEEQMSQGETHTHIDEDSDTDMILDQGSLSIGADYSPNQNGGGDGTQESSGPAEIATSPWQPKEDNALQGHGIGAYHPSGDLGSGVQGSGYPMRVNLPGAQKGDRV